MTEFYRLISLNFSTIFSSLIDSKIDFSFSKKKQKKVKKKRFSRNKNLVVKNRVLWKKNRENVFHALRAIFLLPDIFKNDFLKNFEFRDYKPCENIRRAYICGIRRIFEKNKKNLRYRTYTGLWWVRQSILLKIPPSAKFKKK